jgi:arylsulfatase A-like enzyme
MPSVTPAPRLLVIAVDRLPAWILPASGATWVAMPTVTSWAARGVVFDRLITPHADARETLADIVGPAAAGLPALVLSDDATLPDDACGTAATIRRVPAHEGEDVAAAAGDTNIARLCAVAAEAVAAAAARLVVVHVTGLGHAWDAPEEFRAAYLDPDDPPPPAGAAVPDFVATADTDPDMLVALRHVYAAQLTLLDRCLGGLGALDGWTVLFCGLRGMGLGLHGRVGPGGMLPFGELVHVPAILVDPAGRMAGQRFGGLAVPADLGATLAALASVPGSVRGAVCLADLLTRWSNTGRDRVVVRLPEGAAITTAGWHALAPADGTLRLYAKPDDFFEVSDVADRCPEVADELGRLVAAAASGDTTTATGTTLSDAAARGVA